MMAPDDVRALVTASDRNDPGKGDLRRAARDTRDAMPAAARAGAAIAIADALDREILARAPAGSIIALYAPVATEVDTGAIATRAIARGLRTAYPRIAQRRRLELAIAAPGDLTPGRFRIPEPPAGAPIVAPSAIAAFVIPGLAFDPTGARIGWGHGYYDATLASAPDALRIGVAFESQIVARIPVDPHDVHVHLIITERAVYRGAPVPGASWIPSP